MSSRARNPAVKLRTTSNYQMRRWYKIFLFSRDKAKKADERLKDPRIFPPMNDTCVHCYTADTVPLAGLTRKALARSLLWKLE